MSRLRPPPPSLNLKSIEASEEEYEAERKAKEEIINMVLEKTG